MSRYLDKIIYVAWSDHIEYISCKVNKNFVLYLMMPGSEKSGAMSHMQIQNKAAKLILDDTSLLIHRCIDCLEMAES